MHQDFRSFAPSWPNNVYKAIQNVSKVPNSRFCRSGEPPFPGLSPRTSQIQIPNPDKHMGAGREYQFVPEIMTPAVAPSETQDAMLGKRGIAAQTGSSKWPGNPERVLNLPCSTSSTKMDRNGQIARSPVAYWVAWTAMPALAQSLTNRIGSSPKSPVRPRWPSRAFAVPPGSSASHMDCTALNFQNLIRWRNTRHVRSQK